MLTTQAVALTSDAVDAARTFLRIEHENEDPLIAAFVAAALVHAETYLGQMLIERNVTERLSVTTAWQRLTATPVRIISDVIGLPAEGSPFPLPADSYRIDINRHQDGWIRIPYPGSAGRVDIAYRAGLVAGWPDLPEPISIAVLRIAAHLHAARDGPEDAGPPPAVSNLLRPWRRMRLD